MGLNAPVAGLTPRGVLSRITNRVHNHKVLERATVEDKKI